jgi:hypothetical protein
LSRAAILLDPVHLTLGCGIGECPEQVALEYMNAYAEAGGGKAVWMFSYYTGTIGEYDRGAV